MGNDNPHNGKTCIDAEHNDNIHFTFDALCLSGHSVSVMMLSIEFEENLRVSCAIACLGAICWLLACQCGNCSVLNHSCCPEHFDCEKVYKDFVEYINCQLRQVSIHRVVL